MNTSVVELSVCDGAADRFVVVPSEFHGATDRSVVVPSEFNGATDRSVMVSSECEGAAEGEDAGACNIVVPGGCEYPCVKRLRHRRLLSFLEAQGFDGTYHALLRETDAHFSLGRLQQLIKQGQWGSALAYLTKYLPPRSLTGRGRSYRAQVLLNFLYIHLGIAHVVAGNENKFLHEKFVSQVGLSLHGITLSILVSSPDQVRAAMDWEEVRKSAAFAVYRVAIATPELRGSLYLPTACIMPHDVLPLGFSSRHRRHLKGPGPPPRKTKSIFKALKGLQFKMDYVFRSKIESADGAKKTLSNMIDQSLLAGLRKGYRLPLQPSGKEGEAMFSAFTIAAKNAGILSANDSGAPSSHCTKCGGHLQTMLGSFTDRAKSSGISVLTNAAGPDKNLSEAGCYTESVWQGFNPTKDPRDELKTVDEDRDPKRKRTTGAFGEASLASVIEVGAIARLPAGAVVNFGEVSSG